MKTSYILIDYENVQPQLTGLAGDNFKVFIFGSRQSKKIPFETAMAVQRMGKKAEYIEITGSGKNALDFHLAYYLGQLAAADPKASFHIIAKDNGYGPLIQHLKSRGIVAFCHPDLKHLGVAKSCKPKVTPDQLTTVVDKLSRSSKPRTVEKLRSTINALFQKQLSAQELDGLLQQLTDRGHVTFQEQKVTYSLPETEKQSAAQSLDRNVLF